MVGQKKMFLLSPGTLKNWLVDTSKKASPITYELIEIVIYHFQLLGKYVVSWSIKFNVLQRCNSFLKLTV